MACFTDLAKFKRQSICWLAKLWQPQQLPHLQTWHLMHGCVQEDATVRSAAVFGLGLAYAGKQREELGELLTPLFLDTELPMEVVGYASLALGLIFVGSCHKNSVEAILQVCACSRLMHTSVHQATNLLAG